MITWSRLRWLFGAGSCAWLLACGASQSAAPGVHATTPAVRTAPAPAARPVPQNPIELIVGGPNMLVDLRVDRLRGSPLLARTRTFLERATCMSAADLDWLLASTEHALVAMRDASDQAQWLLVLTGAYTEADASRMLAAVAQRDAAGSANQPQNRASAGRFTITSQGDTALCLLDAHTLLVGAGQWLRAAVEAIDQPPPSAASLLPDLAQRVQCDERSVCMLAAADSVAAHQLQRGLAELGAEGVGRAVSSAPTALGLTLSDGLELAFVAELSTPQAASSALEVVKSWFWQAGLLIRLAGLPDVLDAVRARSDDTVMALELSVSASDLAQYQQRIAPLIDKAADVCATQTAVAAQ
jgi:hypothetical protein